MRSFNRIIRGIKDPKRAVWEVGWLYHRRLLGKRGVQIMKEDWDNLIILDACRYDVFESVNTIEGILTRKISKGSSTREFLIENFTDKVYPDTIYVSANPQTQNHGIDQKFFNWKRLWENHWDNRLNTVRPSKVRDETLKIESKYPDKRIIAHFIQPHYPFIGPKGQNVQHGTFHGNGIISETRDQETIWEKLENSDVSKDTVWDCYVENLKVTLPHVRKLVNKLNGKSVVTSDHGNVFGRLGLYGHPGRRYLRELVEVPWLEPPYECRRTIEPGDPVRPMNNNELDIENHLADLGYK